MTQVVNLDTGDESFYSCSSLLAVVAAYEQSLGNMNTWTYERLAKVSASGMTVSCGPFCALVEF